MTVLLIIDKLELTVDIPSTYQKLKVSKGWLEMHNKSGTKIEGNDADRYEFTRRLDVAGQTPRFEVTEFTEGEPDPEPEPDEESEMDTSSSDTGEEDIPAENQNDSLPKRENSREQLDPGSVI